MDDLLREQLTRRAAAAAAAHPAFLAWALAQYRDDEGLDEAGLATWLGLDLGQLAQLALCHQPRPQAFRSDVVAIAHRFGVAPERLAALLRQVDALAVFGGAPSNVRGMMAAARERDDSEPDGTAAGAAPPIDRGGSSDDEDRS